MKFSFSPCDLILYCEAGDEIWDVPGVSAAGMQALVQAAELEGKTGFVSDKAIELLERVFAGQLVLTSAQVAELEARLAHHVVTSKKHLAEAARRGQEQARGCLGAFGRLMDESVDAVPLALSAIARWLSAYADIVQAHHIAVATRVKPREHPGNKPSRIANDLDRAVDALHATHPEWPVENGGVVRLNPRSEAPLTCVGVYVHFEGHPKQAIVWPTEVR